jgi:hypothetical protein
MTKPASTPDPQRHERLLCLGREVRAKKEFASVFVGEPGIVYERYTLEGRPGYSIIFKNSGFYDGFSPDDVDLLLDITEIVHSHMRGYEFKSIDRLTRDFQGGRIWPQIAKHPLVPTAKPTASPSAK